MGCAKKFSDVCKWCGESLSPTHIGPCPKCGKRGKNVTRTCPAGFNMKAIARWEKRRNFFDENPLIKWLIYILSFVVSPLLGFFLQGEIGVFFGLFIGIISWLLTPYSIIKVIEITHG